MNDTLYYNKESIMKKRTIALLTTLALATGMVAGCGSSNTAATDTAKTSETVSSEKTEATETVESTEVDDQAAADHVAELIDAIYVQTRNDDTDAQCAEAKGMGCIDRCTEGISFRRERRSGLFRKRYRRCLKG